MGTVLCSFFLCLCALIFYIDTFLFSLHSHLHNKHNNNNNKPRPLMEIWKPLNQKLIILLEWPNSTRCMYEYMVTQKGHNKLVFANFSYFQIRNFQFLDLEFLNEYKHIVCLSSHIGSDPE